MTHDEDFKHLFKESRKDFRKEKKLASKLDRSKYKKTDLDKVRKEETPEVEEHKRGRVIAIHSQGIQVDSEGSCTLCVLRGILKQEITRDKNIVAVGDIVHFDKTKEGEGLITHIEQRKTVLARADNLSRRKQQVIAANVDQVLITACVVTPAIKPFLIDRYIIACQRGGLKPIIIVNKIDLLNEDTYEAEIDRELLSEMEQAYAKVPIPLIKVSATTGEGIDQIKEVMKDKVSVFSGQSGVGKSSLINTVTGSKLNVGETVDKTRKGSHTTTMAQLLTLDFGGYCVDTPGIKSFGVWDLTIEDIQDYFDEIRAKSQECRFPNCTHSHEPDCAVVKAVEEGELSALRFESYLQLRQSVATQHRRR